MTNQGANSISGLTTPHITGNFMYAGVLLAFGGTLVFQYSGVLKGWGMMPVSLVFGLVLVAIGIALALKAPKVGKR